MDAAVDIGSNPVSKHQNSAWVWRMSRVTRDGTAKSVSAKPNFQAWTGTRKCFPWSADHVNRIGNLPVDLYSAICYDNSSSSTNLFVFEHTLYRSGCGKNIWMPPWTSGAIPWVSTRFSLSVENEQGDTRRDGQICLAKPNFQTVVVLIFRIWTYFIS